MTAKKASPNAIESANGFFSITAEVNGRPLTLQVGEGEFLLDALRRHGLKGAKKGCETGDCGSCTILVDGQPMLSCLMLAVQAHGRKITTIEGLGTPRHPHPIQEAFVKAGAVQCGYCIPGMILATKALLDANPSPTEEEIRYGLDGNLCRCTGYVKQVEAVRDAARILKNAKSK